MNTLSPDRIVEARSFPQVQLYLEQQFSNQCDSTELSPAELKDIIRFLFCEALSNENNFHDCEKLRQRAIATLAIRCLISLFIVQFAITRLNQLGISPTEPKYTIYFQRILSCFLDDDATQLLVWNKLRNQHQEGIWLEVGQTRNLPLVNSKEELQQYSYPMFSLTVIQRFDFTRQDANLQALVKLMANQLPEFRDMLWHEFEILPRTPWSILKDESLNQSQLDRALELEIISPQDYALIMVFRDIYVRDIGQGIIELGRWRSYPEPNPSQCAEMRGLLRQYQVYINKDEELRHELTEVAKRISDRGCSLSRSIRDREEKLDREMKDTLNPLLARAIEEVLSWIYNERLPNSDYKIYAPKFYQALYLYYVEEATQKAIGEFLNVEHYTVSRILEISTLKGSPKPNHVENHSWLIEHLRKKSPDFSSNQMKAFGLVRYQMIYLLLGKRRANFCSSTESYGRFLRVYDLVEEAFCKRQEDGTINYRNSWFFQAMCRYLKENFDF